MQSWTEKQARVYVDQWLTSHPNRLPNRRTDPVSLRNWQDCAVRRILEGPGEDADYILRRFATKTETHSMH
jgi:hypothetical protein